MAEIFQPETLSTCEVLCSSARSPNIRKSRMADASATSKSAKKNQKRKGKKNKDAKDYSYQDVYQLLKEQLEKAKVDGDHPRANKLRDQVWIMNDLCHGKKTDLPEEEYAKILASLTEVTKANKAPSAQKDRDAEEEEKNAEENGKDSSLTEPEKQLKKLKKKLEAVEKLKAKQEAGQTLEKNQLQKLEMEKTLRDEIEDLEDLIEATLDLS